MADILLPVIYLVILLVAIHSYFGEKIIRRGIIFTDLAIGQIAAVGSSISIAFFHAEYLYLFSLGFALLASLLISYAIQTIKHIEAFIGLLYVLGASSIMLILSSSAEGLEHFNELLAADILFTSTDAIIKSTFIYAGVALVAYFFLKRLKGVYYEMLFFTLLGIVVTSSVQLAGVFVVFTLLIAPALIGLYLNEKRSYLIALISGTIFSTVAIIISFYMDYPTGYMVVFLGSLSSLFVMIFKSAKLNTK